MITELNDEQLLAYRLHPDMLAACIEVTEQLNQTDGAVFISDDGRLVASLNAWQQHLIEVQNLAALAQLQGVRIQQWCSASARTIRSRLHDANAPSSTGYEFDPYQLDHTQAQQALEDLVQQALLLQASDIHLLFQPHHAELAFRVHGQLIGRSNRNRETMAGAIAAALNTRSDDFRELFDEQRLSSASIALAVPHNGRLQRLRLRVQKSPTRSGFAVTIRLQLEQEPPQLAALGFPQEVLEQLQRLLVKPSGLFIVVGATGQGKTTTLAALNSQIPATAKVISLEDPIEIIQPRIEQKPVIADHPELNFANMVKVALREDPDVLSISEIRDQATAQAAYTAALTGHFVTATVHAHDTFGALYRLLDLGLTSGALAQTGVVVGILAQRLVAQACRQCPADASQCTHCHGSGVSGRQLAVELLMIDEELRCALRAGELDSYRQRLAEQGKLSFRTETVEFAL